MLQTPIRLLVIDDHVIVRKGICALLETEPDLEVVGAGADGHEALALAEALHPDVIVMDLVMPGMDGIEATHQIAMRYPEIRILVLSGFATDDKVFPAIMAGALGYLLKDCEPEDLVQAIHQVYRGESSLHPSIARKVLQALTHPSNHTPDTVEALTEREIAVLRLIAQGLSNREIAARLVISEPTVRTHVSNMLSKLHLASRTQAALYALREGLVPPETPDN